MEHISKFLPTTLSKNEGLQQIEQKQQLIGEEKKFEVALQSRLIQDVSFEEIKEPLRYVMMKIGLRSQNWPTDIEKLLLFEHIVSNFGGNRIDEIRLAFDMAIAGKLEVEVNCFENFSCYYFSTIMNAYRKWASQVYSQVVKPKPVEQKIFTQEELDNSAREDAERQYQLFLKGHPLKGLEFNRTILEKDNMVAKHEPVLDAFNRFSKNGYRNIYKMSQK